MLRGSKKSFTDSHNVIFLHNLFLCFILRCLKFTWVEDASCFFNTKHKKALI